MMPSDRLDMIRDRIARVTTADELRRTERALAAANLQVLTKAENREKSNRERRASA